MNNLNDWIININNTSYKFAKSTILSVDKAISHIKKNKKIYKGCVVYLAICLMPAFAHIGKELIYDFMMALASIPPNMILNELLKLFLHIAKLATMIFIAFEIVKACFASAIKNLTK